MAVIVGGVEDDHVTSTVMLTKTEREEDSSVVASIGIGDHCCSWRAPIFYLSLSLFHSTCVVAEYLIERRNLVE